MGLDGKFDELLNQLILIYCTHAETPREVHARTHSDEAPSPHATLIEFVHRHPCQCPGEVFGFRGLHPGALHQAEQHQPEPQSKLQSRPLAWASPQYRNLSLKLNLNLTVFVVKGLNTFNLPTVPQPQPSLTLRLTHTQICAEMDALLRHLFRTVPPYIGKKKHHYH